MKTVHKYFSIPKTLLAISAMALAPLASANLIGYESFSGYTNNFLLGQETSSSTGFAGTDVWTRSSSQNASRDFWARPTEGLTYSNLVSSGGSAEIARTSTFNDTGINTATLASSTPTADTPDELFFSALINADGYTAKSDDATNQGVEVRFLHEAGGRQLGFGFGGASGGDQTAAKTLFVRGFVGASPARIQSNLALNSGTNLVVLSIARPGGSGDNTYSLWLNPNPSSPMGTPDWQSTQNFGIVVNDGSFGFYGFDMTQSFNGEQSVSVDEFRLGTTYDAVTAIPEPGTLVLLGVALGTLAIFRRRR